ncbi:HCL378Cp [Eremothecium sinecaudum]|uniref:HCL378Cp n=1 Tax=Eremothecium sinecaudum TaxID=45286 RepID=A0A109UY90_9SACH|nr:HCL378Cp [Eremothecium sinecaudum]AMD19773.1 HCL378Cp [Eremothecium sinecaudum]
MQLQEREKELEDNRREVLQELIDTEGDYVSMFGLFRESYLKVLAREEEHVVFRSMECVVKELVRWHRRMESDLKHIVRNYGDSSVEAALRVSRQVVAYMAKLEAHYRSYIFHFQASSKLFAEETYYGKVMRGLVGRLDHGVRTYQRTQFSGDDKRHLWQKDTSYDCLSHLPVSRLTNYKLFLEVIGRTVTLPADKQRILGYTRKTSEIIHHINSDNSTMDPINTIIQQRLRFPTVEYVPVCAFGQCILAGCLNTMWVRRRASCGFAIVAEPLGAFLFKSYLILADVCKDWWTVKHCVPMVRCNIYELNTIVDVTDPPDSLSKDILAADVFDSSYNLDAASVNNGDELGVCDVSVSSGMDHHGNSEMSGRTENGNSFGLRMEFYFYGQCFEILFAFRSRQEYEVWKQHLITVKDLNSASGVEFEQMSDVGESTMVPREMVPRTTVASRCPKVSELPKLTQAQRDMLKHSAYDYYGSCPSHMNVNYGGTQRYQQKRQGLSRNKSEPTNFYATFDMTRRLHTETFMYDVWSDNLIRTHPLDYVMTSYSDNTTSFGTARPSPSMRSSWGVFSNRSENSKSTFMAEPNNQDLTTQQTKNKYHDNNRPTTIARLGTINKLRSYLTVKTYNKQFSENQVA